MKLIKYIAAAVVLLILSVLYCQHNFYYKIPNNPFEEHAADSLTEFHLTKNRPDGTSVSASCHQGKECDDVLAYLRQLKLLPLKEKTANRLLTNEEHTSYLTGMLKFGQSADEVFLCDLDTDQPTIFAVSSTRSEFKGAGYYEIQQSEFDVDYIWRLLKEAD